MTPTDSILAETLHWHLYIDGPQLSLVREQQGCLTAEDVKRIGRIYGVLRTLPGGASAFKIVANVINGLEFGDWNSLSERAHATRDLVEKLRDICNLKRRPASAVSKLTWFRAPERWTPFDDLAAQGLGIPEAARRIDRMMNFYERLDSIDFLGKAAAIQVHLVDAGLGGLRGEKVLDYTLMRRARPPANEVLFPRFVELLPTALASGLRKAARTIEADPSCHLPDRSSQVRRFLPVI